MPADVSGAHAETSSLRTGGLAGALWALDAESHWTAEDLVEAEPGRAVLSRHLRAVLGVLLDHLPRFTGGYVALAGLQEDRFTTLATVKVDPAAIDPLGKRAEDGGPAAILNACANMEAAVALVPSDDRGVRASRGGTRRTAVLVKLAAYGEFIGFIALEVGDSSSASDEEIAALESVGPVLSRIIGDPVFTMRLRQLTVPFAGPSDPRDATALYDEVTRRALLGFAADGAILRIYDGANDRLPVLASAGEPTVIELLQDDNVGEGVTHSVLHDTSGPGWTVGMFDWPEHPFSGAHVDRQLEGELRDLGIRSYLVTRLATDIDTVTETPGIGTLAFFHLRPHRFSWRDVSLATSFARRVADIVSLHQRTRESQDSLENLRLQNQRLTQVEVVALLSHDLGHKSFEAAAAVGEYTERVERAMNARDRRVSYGQVRQFAQRASDATVAMEESLRQIRSLIGRDYVDMGDESDFDLSGVFDTVEKVMAGALDRHKITVSRQIPGIQLHGYPAVLSQAFFNLYVNAIEAIRRMESRRPRRIHISAELERQPRRRFAIVTFWDEGPGIDRREFPNPIDIFELGTTTKPSGTGTGLPVTQRLLRRYFQAELALQNAESAGFRIRIPVK